MSEEADGGPTDTQSGDGAGVAVARRDGVCRVVPRDGGPWRWLATGPGGGEREARAAYNVTVPEGFDRTDLAAYGRERRATAGFDADGPTLFTGVDVRHARGARRGPVTVVATGGLSNPAILPVDGPPPDDAAGGDGADAAVDPEDAGDADGPPVGTVNLVVTTARTLTPATRAELLATAVEAKTATLLGTDGFTGTTSDAVVVGCPPVGERAAFAGSATPVGAATRACVREALRASLGARYDGREAERPDTVAAADHGTVTDGTARVFRPDRPASE